MKEKVAETGSRGNGRSAVARGHPFTFIDLFAGIGGMRAGFEAAGGKCVFASEIDKFCRETYRANYEQDHPVVGDIREVKAGDIPACDVLLAGFPCQPFSIAGVSKKNALGDPHGFECLTRGTLFFEIERVLRAHRPAAFLLENVKNLLSHDKGKTFRVIREALGKLGYTCDWRVINAKGHVPQNRERIFIAGFRGKSPGPGGGFSFEDLPVPEAEDGPKLGTILHPEDGSEEPEEPYTTGRKAEVSGKYTLSEKLWEYLREYKAKHRAKGNGFGFSLFGPGGVGRTLSSRYHKDGSEILIRQGEGARPRRLTPRECARIMGFDGPGKPRFKIPVSDTQSYQQFGNAVVVPVARDIARHMRPHILEAKKRAGGATSRRGRGGQLPLPFSVGRDTAGNGRNARGG